MDFKKNDGTIEKYKAHLVTQGFKQLDNINFFNVFSCVTRIIKIRVLNSLVVIYNLKIH